MIPQKHSTPKTSMRTLLPVASFGLALLWSWMFVLVFFPNSINQAGIMIPNISLLSMSFFAGSSLCVALVTFGRVSRLFNRPALMGLVAFTLSLPASVMVANPLLRMSLEALVAS